MMSTHYILFYLFGPFATSQIYVQQNELCSFVTLNIRVNSPIIKLQVVNITCTLLGLFHDFF